MANQLKVAVVHAIEVLFERGWSQRRIAGALGSIGGRWVATPGGRGTGQTRPRRLPGLTETQTSVGQRQRGLEAPPKAPAQIQNQPPRRPPGSTGPEIESPQVSGGLRSVAWGLHSARPGINGGAYQYAGPGRRFADLDDDADVDLHDFAAFQRTFTAGE